jgi:hypothetical protein
MLKAALLEEKHGLIEWKLAIKHEQPTWNEEYMACFAPQKKRKIECVCVAHTRFHKNRQCRSTKGSHSLKARFSLLHPHN